MPELPEVETIARRLKPLLIGKTITEVLIEKTKIFVGDPTAIINQKITDVSRKSKVIQIHLTNNVNLMIHLKMTGQLIYIDDAIRVGGGHPTADWVSTLPSKHTRVTMVLDNDAHLYFNDMRMFGWIKIITDEELNIFFKDLGPDVNTDEASIPYFTAKIARRSQPIKVVIMDNAVISGVGNIYACDALNLARISPFRKANTLSPEEAERLLNACKTVINLGIELGGASIKQFAHVDGFSGNYQTARLAYAREGEVCKNCGEIILKTKLAGRGR